MTTTRADSPRPEAWQRQILDRGQGALGETIALETRSEQELWRCEADPAQLENVMLNLAFNARDAMPEGGSLLVACANARVTQGDVPGDMDQSSGRRRLCHAELYRFGDGDVP